MEPRIPEGTILRAVPQARPDGVSEFSANAKSMSSLELAMATSPNEEILSAIGQPSLSTTNVSTPHSANSPYNSAVDRFPMPPNWTPTSKRPRRTSEDKTNVIGVWKDGRAQWVQEGSEHSSKESLVKLELQAPATPLSPQLEAPKAQRPRIQVIIPNDKLTRPFPSMPFFQPVSSYASVDARANAGAFTSHTVSVPPGAIHRTTSFHVSSTSLIPKQPTPQRVIAELPATLKGQHLERPAAPAHGTRPSLSASTSSDGSHSNTEEEDESSNYSLRSSMTSVQSEKAAEFLAPGKFLHKRTGSAAFSIQSPAAAGVYDDSRAGDSPRDTTDIAELEGSPVPAEKPVQRSVSCVLPPRTTSRKRMSSRRGTRLLSARYPSAEARPRGPTPTLSDAEKDLEDTLLMSQQASPKPVEEVQEQPIQEAELPEVPDKAPTPPPKSKRRSMVIRSPTSPSATYSPRTSDSVGRKRPSLRLHSMHRPDSVHMPDIAEMFRAETPDLLEKQREIAERQISAQRAEDIILHIMESLQSLDDLFNTAVLNKGFYRVYKRHEMPLLRQVLKNNDITAWEYMETCQPSDEQVDADGNPISAVPCDYTPQNYIRFYIQSHATLIQLKALILAKCQSFLRPTTVAALATPDPTESARVDAALWRIWTFCRVFGSSRGREDDIVGQMDWLRGGQLAHQQTCTSTIVSSDSFYMSSVLLNAPEHFARGNGKKGLGAEDLYDMTELWNCFNWLVQGLEGRTEQGRQYGVFDNTEVRGGDIDGEEAMLGKSLDFFQWSFEFVRRYFQ